MPIFMTTQSRMATTLYATDQAKRTRRVLSARADSWAILLVLSILTFVCYEGLSRESFGWYDESRHMMNAVFFADFYSDLPLRNVYKYTIEYFIRFPSLSLSWHPPMFPALAGAVLLVGGLDPVLVRMLVFMFALAGAIFWYFWVLSIWGRRTALLSTLILITGTAVHFWSTAIMLEIPIVALISGALYWLAHYLERPSLRGSFIVGLLVAAMLLTKQTSLFILPAFLLYCILAGRARLLWSRVSLPIYLLFFSALAILIGHALALGSVGIAEQLGNLSELAGAPPRFSIERWLIYGRVLGESFGWPILLLALIGSIEMARRRGSADLTILVWPALWYVAFSITAVDHGDALRYTAYVAPPIALLAACSLGTLSNANAQIRHAAVLGLLGIVAWSGWRSYATELPMVSGFRAPAQFVHTEAGDLPVLYCCRFDGEFIFERRRLDPPRHSITLRADKNLVNFSITPAYGMASFVESRSDILDQLDRDGVAVLVIESQDNLRISQFNVLREVVNGPEFDLLAEFPITGNFAALPPELKLRVYRYRNAHTPENGIISVPAPQIGTTLQLRVSP
jgi:hypothetical protein